MAELFGVRFGEGRELVRKRAALAAEVGGEELVRVMPPFSFCECPLEAEDIALARMLGDQTAPEEAADWRRLLHEQDRPGIGPGAVGAVMHGGGGHGGYSG